MISMDKKSRLTKMLAILGTSLVWLTVLSPVVFWLGFSLRRGVIDLEHFDYLLPAELFLVALVGGGLLVWAALRAGRRLKLIVACLGVAILALVGGQALAVVSGLATGEKPTGGGEWALVMGSLVMYILALAGMGVGGMLLVRELQER
jgi:hypothetical protein